MTNWDERSGQFQGVKQGRILLPEKSDMLRTPGGSGRILTMVDPFNMKPLVEEEERQLPIPNAELRPAVEGASRRPAVIELPAAEDVVVQGGELPPCELVDPSQGDDQMEKQKKVKKVRFRKGVTETMVRAWHSDWYEGLSWSCNRIASELKNRSIDPIKLTGPTIKSYFIGLGDLPVRTAAEEQKAKSNVGKKWIFQTNPAEAAESTGAAAGEGTAVQSFDLTGKEAAAGGGIPQVETPPIIQQLNQLIDNAIEAAAAVEETTEPAAEDAAESADQNGADKGVHAVHLSLNLNLAPPPPQFDDPRWKDLYAYVTGLHAAGIPIHVAVHTDAHIS